MGVSPEWNLIVALEKLVKAQDDMLVVYRTSALHRGATVAARLDHARERVAKANAALEKAQNNAEEAA